MIEDFCKFFVDIEADPTAKVPPITIRDLLLAGQHLGTCDKCYESTVRVQQRYKNESNNKLYMSEN